MRGLKSSSTPFMTGLWLVVALHVSAWIEILMNPLEKLLNEVALHVSAWIEMKKRGWSDERFSRTPCECVD